MCLTQHQQAQQSTQHQKGVELTMTASGAIMRQNVTPLTMYTIVSQLSLNWSDSDSDVGLAW